MKLKIATSIMSKVTNRTHKKIPKIQSEATLNTLPCSPEDDYHLDNTYQDESFNSYEHSTNNVDLELTTETDTVRSSCQGPITPSEEEVRALFSLWNNALKSLDPDQVAARYSKSPCLLPTVSDVPRTDYASVKDYFVHFLEKKPEGTILESHVQTGPNWCMDNGIYEFALTASGDVVKARYSFVYILEGDEWKISHHHSSQMPEEVVNKAGLLGDLLNDLMFAT